MQISFPEAPFQDTHTKKKKNLSCFLTKKDAWRILHIAGAGMFFGVTEKEDTV